MNKVFISPEAARDLSQIKQFISTELKNRSAANRIVGSILKDLRGLGRYPEQGPSIEALTDFQPDLRMLLCRKHIALYRIENETVFVARVLDARQDSWRVLF
jgi:toxin ParE1/3/4